MHRADAPESIDLDFGLGASNRPLRNYKYRSQFRRGRMPKIESLLRRSRCSSFPVGFIGSMEPFRATSLGRHRGMAIAAFRPIGVDPSHGNSCRQASLERLFGLPPKTSTARGLRSPFCGLRSSFRSRGGRQNPLWQRVVPSAMAHRSGRSSAWLGQPSRYRVSLGGRWGFDLYTADTIHRVADGGIGKIVRDSPRSASDSGTSIRAIHEGMQLSGAAAESLNRIGTTSMPIIASDMSTTWVPASNEASRT